MKKLFRVALLSGIATFACIQNSSATSIVDLITYSPSKDVTQKNGFSDIFDLTTHGFVVGTDSAVSGSAIFDLSAGSGPSVQVVIDLASDTVVNKQALQDYTITLTSDLLADINADGKLGFSVKQNNNSSDFFLDSAELDVTTGITGSIDSRAPDAASTAILLGLSCLALFGARSFGGRFLGTTSVKAN